MADAMRVVKWHTIAQEKWRILRGSHEHVISEQDHAPASGEGPGSVSHSTDCDIPGLPLYQAMAQERLIRW